MHSKTSAATIEASERRTEFLNLRIEGKTFAEIGAALGVSPQRAHAVVTEELQKLNAERAEAAAEVTRLELERLDKLLAGVWEQATAGDGPALDRVLAIMNRRARLLGLDAPRKQELSGPGGRELRLGVEQGVAADRELEAWNNERAQLGGPGADAARDPQMP